MPNTPPNHDPRAFVNQDVGLVAGRIADIIAELRPTIILTYGPDGIYGHPDHVMVNKVAWPAVLKAGEDGRWKTPNLYFSAAPKERMRRMAELPNGPFASMDPELRRHSRHAGVRNHDLDRYDAIRRSQAGDLMAHRTQVGDDGPFSQLPPEMQRTWFSLETMRTVPLPWNPEPRMSLPSSCRGSARSPFPHLKTH